MDSDDISHQSWASERNGTVESFTIVWSVSTGHRPDNERVNPVVCCLFFYCSSVYKDLEEQFNAKPEDTS